MSEGPDRGADEHHETILRELGRAYASAVLTGDEIEAELTIRAALDAKLTSAEIDEEIITPAMWLVGRLWARGEISIADEHLATEISLRVLALQYEAVRTVRQRGSRRVLLAAPQGELHVMALQMTANLLREAGFDTVMLGADLPARVLAAAARRHRPDVICLTATMPDAGGRLLLTIHDIQEEWPNAGYVVGGAGVSARLRPVPGIEICGRVSEVVDAADAVVKRASLN